MKKFLMYLLVAGFATFTSCGPSAEEKAAAEKARQDSISAVQAKMAADSMAAVQAMETARQDSMMAAAKADSTAKADEKKNTKKSTPKKPTGSVVNGPDTRNTETKKADDKTKAAFDRFKKK